MISALVLAVGLAMDATAAAAGRGIAAARVGARETLLVAVWFGGFQGAMAAIGWVCGRQLGHFFESVDHWIAFALLGAIGARTLYEGLRTQKDDEAPADPFAARAMLVLAVATSIDALAAGVTIPMIDVRPAFSVAAIGIVTAALSAIGLHVGRKLGASFGSRLDVVGGLVLIGLGVKILIEHTLMA